MLADNSGVVIGEDALSSYYSTNSSSNASSVSTPLTTSATSSSSSSSSVPADRHETGILNFFRRRSWFGFGPAGETIKKNQNTETVEEIMKCFRKNDIDGMEKFIGDEMKNDTSDGNSEDQKKENDSEMWWDDEELKIRSSAPKKVLTSKYTPHPRKGVSKLPPRVLKAVRFDMENTPEDREKRPFTPLFTSTPKNGFFTENGSDSESEIAPLRECDSNTVIPPHRVLNNTSSILLSNTSVMFSLNKCRQQTIDAVYLPSDKNSYKICYDDTDEEEVLEEEPLKATPSRQTFSITKEESESDQCSKTISLHEQSSDQFDMSTNSSVVLGLDCIDSYIHHLEDEIEAANRYAREKDIKRAIEAVRQARHLQERFGLMNENINEMCSKLPIGLEQISENEDVLAAFEDSQWELQLGLKADNFEVDQL